MSMMLQSVRYDPADRPDHGDGCDRDGRFEDLLSLLSAADHGVPAGVLADLLDDRTLVEAAEESGLVVVTIDGVVSRPDGAPHVPLGRLRRARLRGRLGAALLGSSCVDAATVARHLLAGAMATSDDASMRRVVDTIVSLAWSARAAEAVVLAEEALAVLDTASFAVESKVRALVALAVASSWSGDVERAGSVRAQAIELARREGDVVLLSTALVCAEGSLVAVDDDPGLLAEVDRCIDALEDRSEHAARRLMAWLLALRSERSMAEDPARARAWSMRSVELARSVSDPEVLARCLAAQRVTTWHPTRQMSAVELSDEMITIGPYTRRHRELGAIARLQTGLELGDFVGFDVGLHRLKVRTERFGTPVERRWCDVLAGARCLVTGDWDLARDHIAAARGAGAGPDAAVTEELLLAQEVVIAWQIGADLGSMLVTPSAVDDDPVGWGPLRSSWRTCLLGLAAPTLDRDSLERELASVLGEGVGGLRDDLTWGPVVACASLAAVVAKSTSHARMLAEAIEPIADQWAGTAGAVSFGPFRWHLGRLLALLGQREEAEAHLVDVLDRCRSAGARPWSARVHLALATIDPVRHRDHAVAALQLASELGMQRVHELASHALGRVVEPGRPRGLTRREVEVLAHVAEGCTNRDIASRMFLSVKTVERHLLNAYTKASLRNRSEATAFVLRHGLAD